MEKPAFEDVVASLVENDATYDKEAYNFVRDSLSLVLAEARKEHGGPDRQVSGPELVDGFRRLALRRFGPMADTVLETWGFKATRDVGTIVFQLIDAGVFGRTPEDKPEDFDDLFEFHDAFVVPFLPRSGDAARKR